MSDITASKQKTNSAAESETAPTTGLEVVVVATGSVILQNNHAAARTTAADTATIWHIITPVAIDQNRHRPIRRVRWRIARIAATVQITTANDVQIMNSNT